MLKCSQRVKIYIILCTLIFATGSMRSQAQTIERCENVVELNGDLPSRIEAALNSLIIRTDRDESTKFLSGDTISFSQHDLTYNIHNIVSSSGMYLAQAYTDLEIYKIVIVDLSNFTHKEFVIDEEVVDIYWVNENSLLVVLKRVSEAEFRFKLISINGEMGNDHEINIPEAASPALISVHPSLNFIAYRQNTSGGSQLAILNLAENTVKQLDLAEPRIIQWSHDGNSLAVVVSARGEKAKLVILDAHGIERNQINLELPPTMFELSWDPLNEFLVYETGLFNEAGEFITWEVLIDLEKNKIVNICGSGNFFWNPTGDYLAIVPILSRGAETEVIHVYDITDNKTYNIVLPNDAIEIIGWGE